MTLIDGEMIIDTIPDSGLKRRYLAYDLMALDSVSKTKVICVVWSMFFIIPSMPLKTFCIPILPLKTWLSLHCHCPLNFHLEMSLLTVFSESTVGKRQFCSSFFFLSPLPGNVYILSD
jgi:hypothetical protein